MRPLIAPVLYWLPVRRCGGGRRGERRSRSRGYPWQRNPSTLAAVHALGVLLRTAGSGASAEFCGSWAGEHHVVHRPPPWHSDRQSGATKQSCAYTPLIGLLLRKSLGIGHKGVLLLWCSDSTFSTVQSPLPHSRNSSQPFQSADRDLDNCVEIHSKVSRGAPSPNR